MKSGGYELRMLYIRRGSGATLMLAIHEAALYNYRSMTLKLNENKRLQADITPLSDR